MTLEDAARIFDYWQDNPPTYQLVSIIAQMLGWEPPERRHNGEPPDIPELTPEFAAMLGEAAGVPAPVVSLDAMREKNRQKMVEFARRNAAAKTHA